MQLTVIAYFLMMCKIWKSLPITLTAADGIQFDRSSTCFHAFENSLLVEFILHHSLLAHVQEMV